jgi:ribosomal protein L7Ae-like RNA K-turn-binding protein
MDNETLACVASPNGPIRTPVVDDVTKEIVLDRLEKEIIKRFSLTLSVPRAKRPMVLKGGKMVPAERKRGKPLRDPSKALIMSRIKIGTNECTRALEAAVASGIGAPLLILLARDVYPPNILAHIPYLARQVGTPVMLLPGRASYEMGKTMGVKKVAILSFLPGTTTAASDNTSQGDSQEARQHSKIDSFVDFIKSKIPESDA